jgi:hypothetical protein
VRPFAERISALNLCEHTFDVELPACARSWPWFANPSGVREVVEGEFGVGRQVAMFGEQTPDVIEVRAHGRVVGVVALVDDGGAFVWVHV